MVDPSRPMARTTWIESFKEEGSMESIFGSLRSIGLWALAAITSAALGCGGGGDSVSDFVSDIVDDVTDDFEDIVDDFEDEFNDPEPSTDFTPAVVTDLTLTLTDQESDETQLFFGSSGLLTFLFAAQDGSAGSGTGTFTYNPLSDSTATVDYTIVTGSITGAQAADLANQSSVVELIFRTATSGDYLITTTDANGTTQDVGTFTLN